MSVHSKVSYFKESLDHVTVYTLFLGLNDKIMDMNRISLNGKHVLSMDEKKQLKKVGLKYSECYQIVHRVHTYKLQPPTSHGHSYSISRLHREHKGTARLQCPPVPHFR